MLTCTVHSLTETIPDSRERFLKLGLYGVERHHQLPAFCAPNSPAECRDIKSPQDIVEALTLAQPVC